jgi:hypothetical protein
MTNSLSEQVTAIAVGYLGPAARIFLERQTKSHMNGLAFASLEKKHLPELQKWVMISAALLIDKAKAKELSERISAL